MNSSEMRILLLYTSYRQFQEFEYQIEFLEKCSRLVQLSDMLWCCNNVSIPRQKLEDKIEKMPFSKKKLVHKDLNSYGYMRGQFEVLAYLEKNFGEIQKYDYIIHLHPDLFFADESKLLEVLEHFLDQKTGFITSRCFGLEEPAYSTCFFIYKPKFVPHDFFFQCLQSDIPVSQGAERVFFSTIQELDVPHQEITQFFLGQTHRDIDNLGIWHEHQLIRVKLFFIHPILRHFYTLFICLIYDQRFFARTCKKYILRIIAKLEQDNLLKQLSRAGEKRLEQKADI